MRERALQATIGSGRGLELKPGQRCAPASRADRRPAPNAKMLTCSALPLEHAGWPSKSRTTRSNPDPRLSYLPR